jgi:hypothetical protein
MVRWEIRGFNDEKKKLGDLMMRKGEIVRDNK